MSRLGLVALVFAVVCTACGGDDDTTTATVTSSSVELAACTETYADGVVFDTVDELASAFCDRGDGQSHLPGSATTPCADGRTLFWNDEGWGYLGEPFHRHVTGAELVAPQTEQDACTATTATSSVFYTNCDAVKAAGASPLHAGDPGYSTELDRDGDGIACES